VTSKLDSVNGKSMSYVTIVFCWFMTPESLAFKENLNYYAADHAYLMQLYLHKQKIAECQLNQTKNPRTKISVV
jgi:hypothetical protein